MGQVGPRQFQNRLGFQGLDEGRAQVEDQIALQIQMF